MAVETPGQRRETNHVYRDEPLQNRQGRGTVFRRYLAVASVPASGAARVHRLSSAQRAEREDHTLYASHALWETRQHFVDWTHSEHFREAHKNAGQNRHLYIGGPEFEGFEVILTEKNPHYAPDDPVEE